MIVAHIMGVPVEESILSAAGVGAPALFLLVRSWLDSWRRR